MLRFTDVHHHTRLLKLNVLSEFMALDLNVSFTKDHQDGDYFVPRVTISLGLPFPHGLSCFLVSEINILSLGDE